MNPIWLPTAHGIVPLNVDPAGPGQKEERYAALQRDVEDAHGEYRLRRLDEAERILDEVIPMLRQLSGDRYKLLLASAFSLRGRLHWRRAERARELSDADAQAVESAEQDETFRLSIELFRSHEPSIRHQASESRFYTDYGIALYRTGNPREAIRVLGLARDTGAMPADAFAYLGLTYRSLGNYPEAIDALNKGLQLAPGDKVLLGTLAETLEAAAEKSDRVEDRERLRSEALRSYCLAAIAAGKDDDLVSARTLLGAALRIRPGHPQALSMLTLLLRSQGADAAAAELLDRTLADVPTHSWALGLRAMLLRDQGQIDAAIKKFGKVEVGHSPDLAWVWLEHAKTLARSDYAAARKLIRKAAKLLGEEDPQVRQARVQIATQAALAGAAEMGRTSAGLVDRITARSPVLRDVFGPVIGTVVKKLGGSVQSEKAIELLSRTVESWPDRVEAREALVKLLLQQKDYTEAEVVLKKGLDLAPDSSKLLGLKAKLLDGRGQLTEAVKQYRLAARSAPEDDAAFGAMVDALTRVGRAEDALREVERKLAHDPRHGVALLEKGRLLLFADKWDRALETLQLAEKTLDGSKDAELLGVRVNLGEVLRRLGRYEEACQALGRAIEVDNAMCDGRAQKAALLIDIAEYDVAARIAAEAIKLLNESVQAASGPGHGDQYGRDVKGRELPKPRLGWLHNARGWALQCAFETPHPVLEWEYRKAIDLFPDDHWARKNLGGLLLRTEGGLEEGKRLIMELVSGVAVNEIPLSLMGWCYFLLRQYEAAAHWMRAALAADKDDITLQFDLGLVLLAGQKASATEQYARAVQSSLSQPAARQRGLFHVALLDLIVYAKDGRFPAAAGSAVYEDLRNGLETASLRPDKLARLQYPSAAAAG